MSDRREAQEALLKKVDALLSKHHPSAPGQNVDALLDVPLLTDVVADAELTPVLDSIVEPKETADKPIANMPHIADDAVRALASDIFERILNHLDERVAAELQRRVQEQVERAVEHALGSMLADLRHEVLNSVGDAIAEALVDHLGERQSPLDPTAAPAAKTQAR